jgi:hypothetical protein
MSISVAPSTAVSAGSSTLATAGSSSGATAGASQIAQLQAKVKDLTQQLQEAATDSSLPADAKQQKVQLLQAELQAVQQQIAALQQQQQQEAMAKAQAKSGGTKTGASGSADMGSRTDSGATGRKSNPPGVGQSVDVYV